MAEKIEYIRCPRCELNYIDKREKLCKVCLNELQTKGHRELTDEEAKELNLCPICKTNYLMDEEEICSECAAEKELLENVDSDLSVDRNGDKEDGEDNWRAYVENDDTELPEDEFGDMSTIASEDEILEGEDLGFDKDEDDYDEDFDEEFEDDEDFDYSDLDEDFDDEFEDDEDLEDDEDDYDDDED